MDMIMSGVGLFEGANMVIRGAIGEAYQDEFGQLPKFLQTVHCTFCGAKICEKILRPIELLVEDRLRVINAELSKLEAAWFSSKENDQKSKVHLEHLLSGRIEPRDSAEVRLIEDVKQYRVNKGYYELALAQIRGVEDPRQLLQCLN